MPVHKSQQPLQYLMTDISLGRLKLPEIQRAYVWKPTQVANLVESLYLGYPTGSLLLWQTDEPPQERPLDIGEQQAAPAVQPRYLLDGQQRLTSLHRALRRDDHLEKSKFIEIVFNVTNGHFQNESAATKKDRHWVRVADVAAPEADLFEIAETCVAGIEGADRNKIRKALQQLHQIRDHNFHIETLTEFNYETVAQIFVRVNSGGRALKITDLALATLSARWPGVVAKFEEETEQWVAEGYPHLDGSFLTRLLASAVLQRGLSQWSHARLIDAEDEALDEAWAVVQRGLRRLVPILKDIGVEHSSLIPSLNALVPLVMMLGARPSERLSDEERHGLIYCFLVSTMTNRYGGSADSILSRDIPAALDQQQPLQKLLANIGYADRRLAVTPDDLHGRTVTSPYFLLSYLACYQANATDWWDRNRLRIDQAGTRWLEYHHIHPRATLKENYQRGQINELANLAFISERANKQISDRSPSRYFSELSAEELASHYVPTGDLIETADGYLEFLAQRRRLLAEAMTALLDRYAPDWLMGPSEAQDPLAGTTVLFQWHESPTSAPSLTMVVSVDEDEWRCLLDAAELVACVEAAEDSLSSDLTVAGESVPFLVEEDQISVAFGPVRLRGSVAEWRAMLDRERSDSVAEAITAEPSEPWIGEIRDFPILDSE